MTPPDLYITTKSGLGFDDSLTPPADGEYGIKISTGSGLGFSGAPVQGGGVVPPPGALLSRANAQPINSRINDQIITARAA